MLRYIQRRLLIMIPVLWGVATLVFFFMYMLPGDPASVILAQSGGKAESIEKLREQLGLNDPLPVQYMRFLRNAVRGDFGESIFLHQPVSQVLWNNLPPSVELAVGGVAVALLIGFSTGILAALNHNTWIDRACMILAIAGVSMPNFWLALLFMYAISGLSLRYGVMLLPITGQGDLKHLILPAIVLGFAASGSLARLVRSSMLDVMRQEYITTARAKGLPQRVVVIRHALRNALIPVVTMLGLQVGALLGGTVIVETVFSRRGLGRTIVDAIVWKDLPVVQGAVLLTAALYMLANLIVDISYAVIDPRIRYS
ncbi:MAG TPA: ABC transporter permease [Anaerolineae bacterium]|nr:ABC transporter permease [Anaerolineae bacterium]